MKHSSILSATTKLFSAAAIATSLAWSPPTLASGEFDRMVRIIVPYAPGGTSDILARIIAPKLSAAIGQTVIVENKPGASGNLGSDAVAKAAKDGHTLLLLDVGTMATLPSLYNNLSYSIEKDLAPVGMVMFAPYVLAVHPSVPAKTVGEFIKYGQDNPGKLAMANSGIGGINHITALMIGKEKGINWKYVPYKGGSAASRAVVAGESNAIVNGATATLPFVTSGQLVGLAVTGKARLKNVPDLPTFHEAGLPAAEYGTFQGVFTTAGSPPATIRRLSDELQKILALPDIRQKIAEQGGEAQSGKAEELKNWLHASIELFAAEIRAAGIKIE